MRARPVYLCSLAAALAVAAAFLLGEDSDGMRSEVLALASGRERVDVRDRAACARLLSLARRLRERGDERNLALVGALLAQKESALSPAQADELVDLGLHDYWAWNTLFPSWKLAVLNRWAAARGLGAAPQWQAFFRREKVRFALSAPPGRYQRLYLAGNWNKKGELTDLGGWREIPLVQGTDGCWSAGLSLHVSRLRHLYHAVARTAPWPAGRAVAEAQFRVERPMSVVLRPLAEAKAASAASRAARKDIGVAVLGVDGASWHVIIPWVERGFLPNFSRLLKEGAVGTLTAVSLPTKIYSSQPNIYSAMTGKLPYRNGIGEGRLREVLGTSLFRRAAPIWDIASINGARAAAIAIPGSFPADDIRGDMVTDAFYALKIKSETDSLELARDPAVEAFAASYGVSARAISWALRLFDLVDRAMDTTAPAELGERLRRELPRAELSPAAGIVGLSFLIDRFALASAENLLAKERYDLFCCYLVDVDAASHLAWGEFETALEGGGPGKLGRLYEAYAQADRAIGELLARSRRLVVFSDHGFGAIPREQARRHLNMLRVLDLLKGDLDARWTCRFEAEDPQGPRWKAVLSGASNAEAAAAAEYLRQAVYLPSGERMFDAVSVTETPGAPAVLFASQPSPSDIEGLRAGTSRHEAVEFIETFRFQSSHMGNGIIAIMGSGIKPGRLAVPAYTTDVAPTALYLAGLPGASDLDGRALTEAFAASLSRPPADVPGYGSGGSGWLRLLRSIRLR